MKSNTKTTKFFSALNRQLHTQPLRPLLQLEMQSNSTICVYKFWNYAANKVLPPIGISAQTRHFFFKIRFQHTQAICHDLSCKLKHFHASDVETTAAATKNGRQLSESSNCSMQFRAFRYELGRCKVDNRIRDTLKYFECKFHSIRPIRWFDIEFLSIWATPASGKPSR